MTDSSRPAEPRGRGTADDDGPAPSVRKVPDRRRAWTVDAVTRGGRRVSAAQ